MNYFKKAVSITMLLALIATGAQAAAASDDTKAPILTSVAVTDKTRSGNELKYLIEVRATDNMSGIEHITVQFKNLAADRIASVVLRAEDGANGIYSGWLTINAYEPDGVFNLYKVTLADNAENYQIYCRGGDIDYTSDADADKLELPNSASIRLANGIINLDEDAPVLKSISLSVETAPAESEIKLSAQVADEGGSGIDYVKARFVNKSGHGITVSLESENGSYVGTVSEIQTKHPGAYVLERVMIKDNAGNRSVYLPGTGVLNNGLQFVITKI